MDDPQSTEEAQSWDAPTTTPTGNADVDAGNQEVPEQQLLGEEYQQATTDPQAQRQAQTAQRAAYKVQGEDLARRGIGYYTDLQTGAPKQLTDDTGSAITNFDKTTAIGYDSSGNPQKLSYDAQSGQPKLTNPYDAAQPFTDPKTGNIYKAPDNLAWQYQGQDPKIVQQLQQQKEDKLNNQTVTALAAPVALAKQNLTAAQQIAQDSAAQTSTKLQGLGVPMVGADGQPLDLSQADPQALKNSVETSFNSEYASSAANEKPLWGDGLTQSAQALRSDIDRRRQAALQAVDDHAGKLNDVATASGQYDQVRAPVVAIQAAKIDALNQQRVLAGLPQVPVPAEMRRIASLASPPAIPGLDHAGQPLSAGTPQAQIQPSPSDASAIPGLAAAQPQTPQESQSGNTSAQPAANPSAAQGPKAEGVLGSLLRPIATGAIPALGTAAGGIGGGALAGVAGLETGPGAIATAIAGDIAGGAAGGALAQKLQSAVMGGEWTKENQAQLDANMAAHPIASKIGAFIPAIISMLGGGGGKAIRGTVDEAGQLIPGAEQQISGAIHGWLGRTAADVTAQGPSYLAKAVSSLPGMMTVGARMSGAAAAEGDESSGSGFANVIPEAVKGAVTMGPTAFIPVAGGMLGKLLGKPVGDAAILATSNALYDKLTKGQDVNWNELAKNIGTDLPGFALMAGIEALTHAPMANKTGGAEGGPEAEGGGVPKQAAPEQAPNEPVLPKEEQAVSPAPAEPEQTTENRVIDNTPSDSASLQKQVTDSADARDAAKNEGNGLGAQLHEAERVAAQEKLDALSPQGGTAEQSQANPQQPAAPAETPTAAKEGAIPGIEQAAPTERYEDAIEGHTLKPASDEQKTSTQALLDSPEAKEVIAKLGKLKGVSSVDSEKGIPFVTEGGKTKINTRALAHALDALDTPEAKHAYVVNGLDEELKHQASLIALKPHEAEAIGKSLTPQERQAVEHAYGAKIEDDKTAGHEAIRTFMQGAEGKQTEAFKLFTEKARNDSGFRAAIEKVLNLIKQLAKTPGALSDRLSEGIRKTQAVLDSLNGTEKKEGFIPGLEAVKNPFDLGGDSFAPEQTQERLHSSTLEQKNPIGLRVATKQPSGKIDIGEAGQHHFQLPSEEGSEFGFVDKDGKFLTRDEASDAIQAAKVRDDISPQPKVEPSESVTPEESIASEKGRTAEATPEAKKAEAVEPKLAEGAKVRLGKSPQLHTITEELPPAKGDQPDERFFSVTNDRTGETQTVESRDLTPVKARSDEEKAAASAASEKTNSALDKKLRAAGLEPSMLPDVKSKREALKRYEQRRLGASDPNADKLRDAYEAVQSDRERNRFGFQSVKIADVLDEAKLPIDEGKKLIQDLAKKGDVQLYAGDYSLSSERERAAAIDHPGQQSPDTLMHFNEPEELGAADPNADKSKAGEPESAEAKEPSKSPPLTPSSGGASAEHNGEPAQGKTPAERLIRQADAHDIPYSLETLKGLIRGDSKSLDKMRTMLRDKGQEPLGASSPTSPESLKERITRYTPGLEIGKNIVNGIKSLMLPGAIDAEHLHAAETMGARLGEKNRRGEQAAHNLADESMTFEKKGVGNDKIPTEQNPGMQFMSAASKGRQMGEKLDAVKAKLDGEWKKRADLMEEAGVPLQKFRESYFPGMWTRDSRIAMDTAFKEAQSRGEIPEDFDINNAPADLKATIRARVEELLKGPTPSGEPKSDVAQYFSRKPLEGSASFRKAKVFDDVGTGAEFGLKPVDMNPIKVAQAKMEEMDRFIMAHQTFGDFEKQGNLINIGNDGKPMKAAEAKNFNRNDWAKIDDKYGTIWRKGDNGEMIKQGERWAKKPAARIINNYLSSSLYNSPYFGDAYKAWMAAANTLNQSQLGVGSMFHAGFTAMESQVSAAANVIKDVYGLLRGNRTLGDLGKTIGKLPIAVPENLMTGDKVMNAWRDPNGTQDLRTRQIARAVELAGGGFKMEKGLQTDQTQKMIRDWYGDHKIRAAARSPVAAIEMMAKPIMDWLVPRQKAGVFAHMAGRIIDQNPGKSLEDLAPEFRQAWNRVDSRLGQVGYPRIFANNTAKNVIQALVRAPGWSGGTIAELGGAFKDTANFVKEWASTGKLPKDIPDRVAYTMGLIITGAAINGAATYALTGQKPTGTDFVAFRTGKKDEQGNDERFMLPSYLKDLWAYSQHPGQTLVNKAHPLLGMVSSLAKNQDYYGTEIRNPDSNPVAQTGQAAGYVAKQFEPFWIRGEQKEAERRSGTLEKALPLFGVTPAPKEMNLSPAQRLAAQMNAQRAPSLPSTEQQSEHRVARSQATIALRQGDSSVMQKELQQGALRPYDVRSITAKATTDPLVYQVKSLPLEQAERVYAVATPAERAKLLPVLAQKRSRASVPQRPQFSFK